MDWELKQVGHSIVYFAESNSQEWRPFELCLKEFWSKLFQETSHNCKVGDFDRICLELWIDSGRLIGFPNKKGNEWSNWKVGVQITSRLILREYNLLPDPDGENDDFEEKATALEAKIWQSLRRASNDAGVRKQATTLRQLHEFSVWRQSGGDQDTKEQFHLIA